jgi:predicted nucleic acid-binding protein
MSGDRLMVDSVILIDHFNGIAAATRYLKEKRQQIRISVISRAEVLTGFRLEAEVIAARLLDSFPTYGIDVEVADLAARLKRENKWRLPDALQAAVALHHGCLLVTRNTRDFDPSRYSFVRVPYEA